MCCHNPLTQIVRENAGTRNVFARESAYTQSVGIKQKVGAMSSTGELNHLSSEHLQMLYAITQTMTSSLDFDEVLNTVMDSMMQISKAQRGFLVIDADGALSVRVARNIGGSDLDSDSSYSSTVVNQVLESRQPILTNNALLDEKYKTSDSIVMRGLRAIMAAPMLVKDRLVGVVYVDASMRSSMFTQDDLHLLVAVAGQAAVAIENARLYRVAVEKGRMERELQMAREIQESLLPRRMPRFQGYELAARWLAAQEVAGDFYDLFLLPDESLGVVIADVSDKGAPAALFMAAARSMIRSHAFAGMSPQQTIAATNDLIVDDAATGMFVTIYHSVFERGGRSRHINAGHNPPLLYRHATGEISFMPRGGRAVGWFPDNPLTTFDLLLEPGDVLVYYTDGITEAESPTREAFGDERLIAALRAHVDLPAGELIACLEEAVRAFCCDVPPFDDITLCVLRYVGR